MVLRQIPVSVTMGELGCPGQGRGRVGVGGLPLWDSRELTFSNDMRGGASNLKKRIMKVKVTQSFQTRCQPMDCPWTSPGLNTGGGSLSLLQGIFPT